MKHFTTNDTRPHAGQLALRVDYPTDLIYSPLWWHKRGLQKTASGYAIKIESLYKIFYNGRQYRIYHTIFSNAGSAWFKAKGQTIYVN